MEFCFVRGCLCCGFLFGFVYLFVAVFAGVFILVCLLWCVAVILDLDLVFVGCFLICFNNVVGFVCRCAYVDVVSSVMVDCRCGRIACFDCRAFAIRYLVFWFGLLCTLLFARFACL